MEQHDERRPWYREFWPWFLMLFPAAAVVGGILTFRIAADSDDGVVDDDYYKQGLAINRVLARGEAAAAVGLRGEAQFGDGNVSLHLTGRLEPWPQRVVLRILHPTRAGMDQTVSLNRQDTGRYEGRCRAPGPGKWKLMLEDEDRSWRLVGQLNPGRRQAALLPLQ